LRLVAVPDGWPPYDCEAHGATCPAADPGANRQPVRPTVATAVRNGGATDTKTDPAAGAATAGEAPGTAAGEAPGATAGEAPGAAAGGTRAAHPDQAPGPSAAWCGQFAQVLVEILAGYRPAKQLARATTEQVRAQISLLSCAVADGQRPRIRRVMMSRPDAGVVEMTAVVSFGSRSRAVAMRFEHVPARPPSPGRPARPARWLCTEIETS
jgi:hypothetical protein